MIGNALVPPSAWDWGGRYGFDRGHHSAVAE